MALVNQDLVLDVVPGPIPPILHLTEYDENMEVVVTLQRRGQPFQIPTGTTVKIEGTLKGHPFSENATPSGNTVTFSLTESMTAFAGRAWTKIKLTQNNKPVSTCGFWLDVDRAGVEAGDVIGAPGFQEQIQEAVDDWLDEHGGVTIEVDDTLTEEGMAADAKAVGDALEGLGSRIDDIEVLPQISTDETLSVKGAAADSATVGAILLGNSESTVITDFSTYQKVNAHVGGTNTWLTGSQYQTAFIPIPAGTSTVTVTAGQTEAFVCLLKNMSAVAGTTPTYATGYNARNVVAAQETVELPVSDALYLSVCLLSGGNSYSPSMVRIGSESGAGLVQRVEDLEDRSTDTTLAVSGMAADAKTVGDILYGGSSGSVITDFSGYTTVQKIVDSSGQWSGNDPNNFSTALIPLPSGVDSVQVTASGRESFVCFLKDISNAGSGSVHFATGYTSRITVPANTTSNITLNKTDEAYISVCLKSSGNSYAPSKVEFISALGDNGLVGNVAYLMNEVNDLQESIGDIPERVSNLESSVLSVEITDYSDLESSKYVVNSSGAWLDYNSKSVFIPVDSSKQSSIVVQTGARETFVSFLTGISNIPASVDFSASQQGRVTVSANTEYNAAIPSDTEYIAVTVLSGNVSYAPTKVTIHSKFDDLINGYSVSGEVIRETPKSRGARLGYKRALQLALLPWTALSAVPTSSSATGAAAGAHTGVIYSSVKEYDKYVGYNVSIRTFMTAAHNPYSLLYTEDTLGTRSKSAYGITYHGVNCGAYFGAVCNTFALYAAGVPIDYNTAEFADAAVKGIFERVFDQSGYGLELMDILWVSGHGRVVTDLWRNNRGDIVNIEVREQVHDFPTVSTSTPQAFMSRYGNPVIYRYKDLDKAIQYEPSQFVAVEDEIIETPYVYNDDICTYAGDYACFYQGEAVHINYAKGSYTSMQLYKGDTLIQTIPLPSSYNATHSVDVTSYLTGAGKYKARLTNGSANSDYTYFEVVDCNVSYTLNGSTLTVEFSSTNGAPQYVQITDRAGNSKGIYPLSASDISAGRCVVTPSDFVGGSVFSGQYLKVFFVGDYGIVRNDYMQIA